VTSDAPTNRSEDSDDPQPAITAHAAMIIAVRFNTVPHPAGRWLV